MNPRVGVGVVVFKEGKTLFGKRKGAHGAAQWSTVGGHLEFKETILDCAKRELEEETGLIAKTLALGPWVENIFEGDKHYITVFVFVTEFEGMPQLLEPDKCEGWHWFDWDHVPTPLFASVASMIQKYGLENLKGNYENSNLSRG